MNNIEVFASKFPEKIDCAIITSEINRRYFTGFKSSAGMLVIFKNKSYFLADFRYFEKAKEVVTSCEVVRADDYYGQLAQILQRHGAKNAGVESEKITVAEYEKIRKHLTNTYVDSTSAVCDVINEMRAVKSIDEIQKILTAQRIAEKAFDNILNHIDVGVSEKELAMELNQYLLKGGADEISFDTIVLSGINTSLPHGEPTDKVLKYRDFVLFDFGAVFEGYHSDMTRTVCVGEPNDTMERAYYFLLEAQNRALAQMKAGNSCKSVDAAARDYLIERGYGANFGHGLGHGVGLEIHEGPVCNTRSDAILQAGNIVTCEPGIYFEKKFGIRIEDMVAITADGCTNLTRTNKKLIVI